MLGLPPLGPPIVLICLALASIAAAKWRYYYSISLVIDFFGIKFKRLSNISRIGWKEVKELRVIDSRWPILYLGKELVIVDKLGITYAYPLYLLTLDDQEEFLRLLRGYWGPYDEIVLEPD
ncbi:MAG: hypothetical protein WC517_04730 [Patescibacteria group bacterium]